MSDFVEVMATVERLRAEKYPQIPEDLVRTVLMAEAENPNDRKSASLRILQSVLGALEALDLSAQMDKSNA